MQYSHVYTFLMQKLEEDLPAHLTYHNAAHTKEVVHAVQWLAASEHVSGDDLQLLSTAALFHDAGFLEDYANHEENSCRLARTYLPRYAYSEEQTDAVCSLIMATKIPHQPKTSMERMLCDADLAYLGADQFLNRSESLYQELKAVGQIKDRNEWQHVQMNFLQSHQYFTQSASKQWTPKKLQNIHRFSIGSNAGKKAVNKTLILQDAAFIIAGVIIAGFALKGFLAPNHFFDGGVTGISLLLHELYQFNLSLTLLLLNLPFIVAGFFVASRRFAIRTLISVVLLGICLLYIPYPIVTSDKLLISIFGGIFLGIGSGLVMRAGCALDGIEVPALYTFKRTSFTIYEIILGINIVIFSIAAFRFGLETALYSVLTYLAATKTVDFVVEGIEAYTGVTIISGNSEVIKSRLVNELGRSITIYKGERGYLPGKSDPGGPCDIIFTVITRLELRKLKNVVAESDPNAFVFASTIRDASGGIIKRRHVH